MKRIDLSSEHDAVAVFEFAMTFDGYERFGSFEASALAAELGDRSSIDLIRNELFFAARASRHQGDDNFLRTYQELLPLLMRHAIG